MPRQTNKSGANNKTQNTTTGRRGSKSASVKDNLDASTNDISRIITESFQYFDRDIVKSDEECAERLNDYFRQCAETGQIPTVEDMSLALGAIRKTIWNWEHGIGCSKARTNMIQKAKEILAGIDAKLVSEGKIPQVTYIFRAKNFFGMKDQQDVVVTPNNVLGEAEDPKHLEERYLQVVDDIPVLEEKEIIDITNTSALKEAEKELAE